MAAYLDLAAGEKATDLQKSDALRRAARWARRLRDYARAEELAGQIPIEAVAKTVRMENLYAQRTCDAIVERFGEEDLSRWPFRQVGAGALARARAYVVKRAGDKAEVDLQTPLAYTSDARTRVRILALMGDNREKNLKDDDSRRFHS